MARKIIYRNQLLQAVEAFLERTPVASMRAQRIIQRCTLLINSEEKFNTLDHFIWSFYFHALTDLVYYESEEFLQETREILLGKSVRNITRMVFNIDYSRDFTVDETEWYSLLMRMIDVLNTVPFAKISQDTAQNWPNIKDWKTIFANLPESVQVAELEEEYQQKKAIVKDILARNPSPENIGDETIYHLVLREITSLLSEINISMTAIYFGHPILGDRHTTHVGFSKEDGRPDIIENVLWAQKILKSLTGQGAFFLSWRLSKAPTFHADALVISLH